MQVMRNNALFFASLFFIYFMLYFTFKSNEVFWYLYSFIALVVMAIAVVSSKFEDQLPTWRYLLYGIGYGTMMYGMIRFGYFVSNFMPFNLHRTVSQFLMLYGPSNIGHHLLLIFIIAVGEEFFWRGYIQQKLKQVVTPFNAVIITSILAMLSILISGFVLGSIAAFFISIILGLLYEWRKSMPLILVAHIVFVVLLFLVMPLI